MTPKLTIAIWYVGIFYHMCPSHVELSGGGVGGLACAVALTRYPDIQVDIYEAAREFTEVGAGVGVWPRAWKVVEDLGLDQELGKVAVVAPDHHPSQ